MDVDVVDGSRFPGGKLLIELIVWGQWNWPALHYALHVKGERCPIRGKKKRPGMDKSIIIS